MKQKISKFLVYTISTLFVLTTVAGSIYANNDVNQILGYSSVPEPIIQETTLKDTNILEEINGGDLKNVEKSSINKEETVDFIAPEKVTLDMLEVDESSLPMGKVVSENIYKNSSEFSKILDKTKDSIDIESLDSVSSKAVINDKNTTYNPDRYEPNNTKANATPFSETIKFDVEEHPWAYEYVSAGIHEGNDMDVYSLNVTAGEYYFFHLKNNTPEASLYVIDETAGKIYHEDSTDPYNEEYFYLKPTVSGTYYVVIQGNGQPEATHYFLFAGKAIRTRTLRTSTHTRFKILSAGTTDWLTFDATNKVPHKITNSIVNSVRLTNTGVGTIPYDWTKQLYSSDKNRTYSANNSEYVSIPNNVEIANQEWKIRAVVSDLPRTYTWSPHIYMTYTCFMERIELWTP